MGEEIHAQWNNGFARLKKREQREAIKGDLNCQRGTKGGTDASPF